MKISQMVLTAGLLHLSLATLSAKANAAYFHVGLNQLESGYFAPVYGNDADKKAGFITPVFEHDSKDGNFLIPGVSWNPLNLGYIGSVRNGISEFLHGKVAAGPSVQTGELVKQGLRLVCQALPQWGQDNRYGVIKAMIAPGQDGIYADVGIYGAEPLNALGSINNMRRNFEVDIAGTLNKKFGGPAVK